MKLLRNNWPKSENSERYKILAELILELVIDGSWESYKSHSLSTIMKLMELNNTCRLVISKSMSKATLKPIIQEVNEALREDLIVHEILAENDFDYQSFTLADNMPTEKILSNVNLLLDLTRNNYEAKSENLIIKFCAEKKSKNSFIVIIKLYVAYLLGIGFTKKYIIDVVTDAFYSSNINRCSSHLLKSFFSNFGEKKRNQKYDILVCCKSELAAFAKATF